MAMQLQFAPVLAAAPILLHGLWLTVKLSVLAIVLGSAIGLCAAMLRSMARPGRGWPVDVYVELIRNTPFLIQIFVIYFGLPSMGLKMSSNTAALLALVVNVGAYGIEIIRAGIESIQKGQIEAGKSLGMRPLQIFRYIILKPAIQAIARVSRPGRRVYRGRREIKSVIGGLGISILTTPRGIMTGRAARRQGVGGEVLCEAW